METQRIENVQETIRALNMFLCGEISAVETYRVALDKVSDAAVRARLEFYPRSHGRRIDLLRKQIRALGGETEAGSGAWGVFANGVEVGGALLGDAATIAALDEGEAHALTVYRDNAHCISVAEAVLLVTSKLLPAQEKTHAHLSQLKKSLPH